MTSPSPAPAAIGLGCVTFGREIDADASFALMDHAWARGVRFFDTAAAYGGGASENIVGRWLDARGLRSGGPLVATKMLPPYTPAQIEAGVRDSLARLRSPRLDVLFLHRWDPTVLDPGTLEALDRLVRDGRVAQLAFSNVTAPDFDRVLAYQRDHGLAPFRYLQNNHNLAVREIDDDLRRICREHSVAIVTYSPLAAGFLTGKHQHGAAPDTRFTLVPGHQKVYFHPEAFRRLAHLQAVAARTGHTTTQLALAWALHQPGVSTVLVGGRSPAHLDQAFAAAAFGDRALLDELSAS